MESLNKAQMLTGVLQKLGFCAKLNIWNTNKHCAKFEHSYNYKFHLEDAIKEAIAPMED